MRLNRTLKDRQNDRPNYGTQKQVKDEKLQAVEKVHSFSIKLFFTSSFHFENVRFFPESYRFIHVGHHEKQQVRLLKLQVMALQLVFTVKASNKSALFPTEAFLKEVEAIGRDPELVDTSHFVAKVKGFYVPWISCIFVPEFD